MYSFMKAFFITHFLENAGSIVLSETLILFYLPQILLFLNLPDK